MISLKIAMSLIQFLIKLRLKIRSWAQFFIIYTLIKILKQLHTPNKKTLCIIKPDAIGDYLLFRPTLAGYVSHYKSHTRILCANEEWKPLFKQLDPKTFHKVIWINIKKFHSNLPYKCLILTRLYRQHIHTTINPTPSRKLFIGDLITLCTLAPIRIGCDAYTHLMTPFQTQLSDSLYTQLIHIPTPQFEANAYQNFYQKLTTAKTAPLLKSPPPESETKGILVFPGSKEPYKQWPAKHVLTLLSHLKTLTKLPITLCGLSSEIQNADAFASIENKQITNLIDKTTLTDITALIKNARLIITVDSAPLHLAKLFNKPFCCIAHGNHYGRFYPYPENLPTQVYVYPPSVQKIPKPLRSNAFSNDWKKHNINTITPTDVYKEVLRLLT